MYVVKKGDSLSGIAERLNIPVQELLIWNHLDLNQPIRAGDRLVLNPANEKKLSQEPSP